MHIVLRLVASLILAIGVCELWFVRTVNFDALGVILGVDSARIVEGIVGVAVLGGILLIGVMASRAK